MIMRDLFWYPMHHPMLYPEGNLRLNALHEDTMYLRDPVWYPIHHLRLHLEGNLRASKALMTLTFCCPSTRANAGLIKTRTD
ncbi:hypothetical protein LINPERHAP1_LOCUS17927 [Linum perenne]